MSRRRLWTITAFACLLMIVPGMPAVPALPVEIALALLAESAAAVALPPESAQLAVAAGLLLLGTGALLGRRRSRPELVLALSRRGRSGAAIARRTGLARDAVRDVLGGEPLAISTGGGGRIFRPAPAAGREQAEKFAEVLAESSFGAKG